MTRVDPVVRRTMRLTIERDYTALSVSASDAIASAIGWASQEVPDRNLNVVLSAGSTPIGAYSLLVSKHRHRCDWSRVTLWQMDEFVGHASGGSFAEYLRERLIAPLSLQNTCLIPAVDEHVADEMIVEHEDRLQAAGGIDLVLHGIGANGHLGFNEPGSSPDSRARLVRLADETRASMRVVKPPIQAVTLGMRCLLEAKRSIVLAASHSKARALASMIDGPVSSRTPASWLRLAPYVSVMADAAAANDLLTKAGPADYV